MLQDASAEPPPPEIPEPEPAPASTATPRSVTISDADLDRPQQPSASAFPPGIGLGDDDEGPHDAFAMPYRESSRRPVWIWIVVGLVALVVIVVLFNLFFGGDGGESDVTPEEAIATMCGHVQQTQLVRDQALAQAQETLRADAKAIKQAGDTETAAQVRALIAVTGDLRRALANQEATADETRAQAEAIAALPCGG